jgi:hypothetical protein
MKAEKILADLRREREQIEEAILSMQRLAAGGRSKKSQTPQLSKRPDDLDDDSSEGSSDGSAGVLSPLRPRRPRRPPKTGRAGAALELELKLADAVARYCSKRPPTDSVDAA